MHFKVLEIRNIKSFGDVTQRIVFDDLPGITLIMGQNNDVVDTNSRNGCGKSSILDALCFVLTDKPLKKNKKKEGLVNRKYKKNGVVTLLFEHTHRGVVYEGLISRGIAPSFCHFYLKPIGVEGDLQSVTFTRTRDSMAQTTADIIAFTGMTANVFRQVMLVASKQPSVLELENSEQANLCEMIFGFEFLSEKGVAIKKQRDLLERQLELVKTKIDERKIGREQQIKQIERLEIAYAQFETDKKNKLESMEDQIKTFEGMDFEAEQARWDIIAKYEKELQDIKAEITRLNCAITKLKQDKSQVINTLGSDRFRLEKLKNADPTPFILSYDQFVEAQNKIQKYTGEIKTFEADLVKERTALNNLINEIEKHTDNCPTCHQTWPDQEARANHIVQLAGLMESHETNIKTLAFEVERLNMGIGEEKLFLRPNSDVFKSRDDAVSVGAAIKEIEQGISRLEQQAEKYEQGIVDADGQNQKYNTDGDHRQKEITREMDQCFFKSEHEFRESFRKVETLAASLETLISGNNPHLKTLEDAKNHLPDEVDDAEVKELKKQIDHRKYLEKRLTNKNSDIRRGVMQIWLPRLNEEVYKNLEAMDLPYRLLFNDDFTVSTIDTSEETDFALVSSGEEERAIIAVALALRKVYEGIHGSINLFCVDERLDSGLDDPGAARAMSVLKAYSDTSHKSILLISHKKEMMDYADRVMTVVKEAKESRIVVG
jgi:DNA repair exonuclease SbcCD ATPase subunit